MARTSTRLRGGIIVLVLLVGAGIWAWRASQSGAPVSFRTARVDRGPVEAAVTATGALNAVVTVQVGSQISGSIQKLGADFNSEVKQGQVVAQIDPTRFRANLAQAEAALKSAQAQLVRAQVNVRQAKVELDRARELATKQVIGAADLDAARSKYDQAVADEAASDAQVGQARASVGVARVDLEHTTIRAPISGVVLQRSVDVGQTVAASLQAPVLFTIAQDLARMEVHAAVDEADVGKLREGLDATFTVDAYPGASFRAQIFQIRSQPTVAQNVVTYDAVLRVDNKDGRLRPGMTATVRAVSARHEDALRVPNAALRFRPGPDLIEAPASGDAKGEPRAPAGAAQAAERAAAGRAGTAPPVDRPEVDRPGGSKSPGRGGSGGGRVYVPRGGKVAMVRFRAGISDDEYTEVLSGALHEGDEVVTDVSGGAQKAAPAATPGANRGRGPRLF